MTSGVTLEFIQRNDFRKFLYFLIKATEIAHGSNSRHIEAAADFCSGNQFFEREDDLRYKSAGDSVVTRKKSILLKETLAAGTAVAAFAKVQEGISGQGNIFNYLYSVIMDMVCSGLTGWANMWCSWEFNMNMQLVTNIFNIGDYYIFQIEKF